ncbi:hypothetical protein [Yinghuangia seranimata]|uniref:hypothetical protein n=1 Tax=Yinghuangia seranimata TaxID=408067 RepID=UPI00248B6657|nr:hypothetical protein [Yinghuangia seranimata]MDI2128850.1 hypothetical protein [Yinghuangia seranimata]
MDTPPIERARLKALMAESVHALPPTTDLVPGALVEGRRRRRRVRLLTAVVSLSIATAVAGTAVAVPRFMRGDTGQTAAAQPSSAPRPWLTQLTELTPPTATYPLVERPLPNTSGNAALIGAGTPLFAVYQQRMADILHRLLPPGNSIEVVDGMPEFIVHLDNVRYGVSVNAATGEPPSANHSPWHMCPTGDNAELAAGTGVTCTESRLPNGDYATINHQKWSPAQSMLTFGQTMIIVGDAYLAPNLSTPLPLTDAQRFAIIMDPELIQVADYFARNRSGRAAS